MLTSAALFLYELTGDPMYLSAVRVLAENSMADQVASAEEYIRTGYRAYLTLYRNSSTHRLYEFDL